jgi:transposase
VKNELVPMLNVGDVLVMDNLRTHHITEAKQMIKDAGIELIFTPPYSPEYNPIEETWSTIKSVFKKLEARNMPQYFDTLQQAKISITPQKLTAFYRHAGYYLTE